MKSSVRIELCSVSSLSPTAVLFSWVREGGMTCHSTVLSSLMQFSNATYSVHVSLGSFTCEIVKARLTRRQGTAESGSRRSARCGRESEINCYTLFSGCERTFSELSALRVWLFELRKLGMWPLTHSWSQMQALHPISWCGPKFMLNLSFDSAWRSKTLWQTTHCIKPLFQAFQANTTPLRTSVLTSVSSQTLI